MIPNADGFISGTYTVTQGSKLRLKVAKDDGGDIGVTTHYYLDDVKMVKEGIAIREEKNYYPFGLKHKGYNDIIIGTENNYKHYQSQEWTEDLGLNIHEWRYRISDPAIGRFWQIDPLAESFVHNGTYNFSENRVTDAVELEGLEALVIHAAKDYHKVMNRPATSGERNAATTGVSIVHPIAAYNVGSVKRGGTNISSVSGRVSRHVAENNNMSIGLGSERNAFRHALWSATMKNEFGEKAATRIGNAHEGVKAMSALNVDFDLPMVQDAEYADSVVDVLNNDIGMGIADELGENASQIDIAKEVLKAQLNEGLWTSSTDEDGNISISRTKITQKAI